MTIAQKEGYQPLTEATAIQLIKELGYFHAHDQLRCREIGDGNLNLVFHIQDENDKALIIKQALPYAKVVGESWPLTLHRATIEGNYLKNAIPLVTELVPQIHHTDEVKALTIMEDLSHLDIVRTGFIAGKAYPNLSRHIGEYLAKTLFFTSDFGCNQQVKKGLQQAFSNPELCKITEDLVFSDPFHDSDTNDFEPELKGTVERLWQDDSLKLEIAKLKYKFLTHGEALLHGDLHTGSIFANETDTKVIDPEFAFFGPIGFDIGQFFANLLFQAITRTEENRDIILSHIHQVWKTFEQTFTELWHTASIEPFTKTKGYLEDVLKDFFQDSIGFAGCELIRRTIGLAHVADLDGIEYSTRRLANKEIAIRFGRELILHRTSITCTKEMVHVLEKVKRGE